MRAKPLEAGLHRGEGGGFDVVAGGGPDLDGLARHRGVPFQQGEKTAAHGAGEERPQAMRANLPPELGEEHLARPRPLAVPIGHHHGPWPFQVERGGVGGRTVLHEFIINEKLKNTIHVRTLDEKAM
jgi:hypothetical protein